MIEANTDYAAMSTVGLRSLVRERGIAQGSAVASARKEDLIALLEGRGQLPETPLAYNGKGSDELADVLARVLSGRIQAGLDEDRVQQLIADALDEHQAMIEEWVGECFKTIQPKVTQIVMPKPAKPVDLGTQAVHRQLPQVLAWLIADVPVWLWGAPGAGKTHLARQLAECLGVKPYVMSIDETTTANKLLGFQNLVSGDFVKGWLYEPYKTGGLVMIDEIDTGNPGIIAGLNALLANSHYLFPNGETVERHAGFRVIAAANTNGTGAVAGFTARQRLDAATLNRFAVVEFRYDEVLETLLACGVEGDVDPWRPGKPADESECVKWVSWVQRLRKDFGKHVLISPRASLLGVRALRAGIPAREVADALVFALCAADTMRAMVDKLGNPGQEVTTNG